MTNILLNEISKIRQANGLPNLEVIGLLNDAASNHCLQMVAGDVPLRANTEQALADYQPHLARILGSNGIIDTFPAAELIFYNTQGGRAGQNLEDPTFCETIACQWQPYLLDRQYTVIGLGQQEKDNVNCVSAILVGPNSTFTL